MQSRNNPSWIWLVLLLTLSMATCSRERSVRKNDQNGPPTQALVAKNLASFDHVWNTIQQKHWDPTLGGLDWKAVRAELRPAVAKARSVAEARVVLMKMIARLKQSHFGIIPASTYAEIGSNANNSSDPQNTDRSADIGIQVRIVDQQALVFRVLADSPAARAQVKRGWCILSINDKKVQPILEKVAKTFTNSTLAPVMLSRAIETKLVGKENSQVVIEFETGPGLKRLTLTRVKPSGQAVSFGNLPPMHVRYESKILPGDVGYITFNIFLDPVRLIQSFGRDVEAYHNTRGIIIDLRGNPGGIGGMAIGMGGFLVNTSNLSLGTMITRQTSLKFVLNPRPKPYLGKVAILIDGSSLSTSEIMAAGLRDVGRARLFGSRTGGAALPSAIERLANGDGFQYALANYKSSNGLVLEGRGVTPDEPVPLTRADLLAGRDAALEAALRWIKSAQQKK